MENIKIEIIKEHPQTKDLFPLGFQTVSFAQLSEEDITSEGFWTNIRGVGEDKKIYMNLKIYVEPKTTPKGTLKNVILIGNNGGEYSSDWFYRNIGRSFTEFVKKI